MERWPEKVINRCDEESSWEGGLVKFVGGKGGFGVSGDEEGMKDRNC